MRDSENSTRKYRYSWEITETPTGIRVGVNTGLPNQLVSEAITEGVVRELQGYPLIRPEVRYGEERSRIDLLLSGHHERAEAYIEIKNVTTCDHYGAGFFPDAVSVRATKHLRELMRVVEGGGRAVLFYCVQRSDVERVRPADEIDPVYGKTLREAASRGVELLAYRARVEPEEILLVDPVPVDLS